MSIYNHLPHIPYTYLIGWSQHDTWYYGVRYSATSSPNDLWKTYFTSSGYVKNFRKLYGEPDVIRVRRTFDSKEKALYWEHKVLRRMKVKLSDRWLNKNDLLAPPNGPHSEETKRKISEANKGKKRRPFSEEHRRKISEAFKGRTRSEEHNVNLSKSLKGKTRSEETKRKMSETSKNMSKEHRRKISEAAKGRTCSDETRRKISKSLKGKTRSEETRQNISRAAKSRTHSEETKRKMSEAKKGGSYLSP